MSGKDEAMRKRHQADQVVSALGWMLMAAATVLVVVAALTAGV